MPSAAPVLGAAVRDASCLGEKRGKPQRRLPAPGGAAPSPTPNHHHRGAGTWPGSPAPASSSVSAPPAPPSCLLLPPASAPRPPFPPPGRHGAQRGGKGGAGEMAAVRGALPLPVSPRLPFATAVLPQATGNSPVGDVLMWLCQHGLGVGKRLSLLCPSLK